MSNSGYTRCQANHYCYIKRYEDSFITIILYVDNMLIVGMDIKYQGPEWIAHIYVLDERFGRNKQNSRYED